MTFLRLAPVGAVAFAVVVVACKTDDPPPENNGVNDVKLACRIRATWPAPPAEKCAQCMGTAALEDCGCEALKDWAAKCVVQGRAKRAEPTCTASVDDCVRACGSDCDCADHCYDAAPKCKPLAAAEDGCLAEVCAPWCEGEGGAPPVVETDASVPETSTADADVSDGSDASDASDASDGD